MTAWFDSFLQLPKAELHVHVEGSIAPRTVCELAARYGVLLQPEQVSSRYSYADFQGFLDAFKWVTSFLRAPEDYALITRRLCEALQDSNVQYAELTVSVGVMLLRKQDAEVNFAAMRAAAESDSTFPRVQWIFDAVRQFGAGQAMEVAQIAVAMKDAGVVAFGLGGDEVSLPAEHFRGVYDYVAEQGLHRLIHAGEIGGPQQMHDAVEFLGAERIGHGIAAYRDIALMEVLAERHIPLEICPASNFATGALARQLGRPVAVIQDHPLPHILRRGVPVTLATDDPAMFRTNLNREYVHAREMGLSQVEIVGLARSGVQYAFLPHLEKKALLATFEAEISRLGLV